MTNQPLKIELVSFSRMEVSANPNDGVVITGQGFGGRAIELHLTAGALLQLEAFLTKANLEQAKHQPSH